MSSIRHRLVRRGGRIGVAEGQTKQQHLVVGYIERRLDHVRHKAQGRLRAGTQAVSRQT